MENNVERIPANILECQIVMLDEIKEEINEPEQQMNSNLIFQYDIQNNSKIQDNRIKRRNPANFSSRTRITNRQKTELLERVVANYNIAINRHQSINGNKLKRSFWNKLTTDLNAMGGAVKDLMSWRKSFSDIRRGTRMKLKTIEKDRCNTVNDEVLDVELSSLEEHLINVMSSKHAEELNTGQYTCNVAQYMDIERSKNSESNLEENNPIRELSGIVKPRITSSDFDHPILNQFSGSSIVNETKASTPTPMVEPISKQQSFKERSPPTPPPHSRNQFKTAQTNNNRDVLLLQTDTSRDLRKQIRLLQIEMRRNERRHIARERSHAEATAQREKHIRLLEIEMQRNERRHAVREQEHAEATAQRERHHSEIMDLYRSMFQPPNQFPS